MGAVALYRRFRPDSFDKVIGQDHITTTLINQVKSGNIAHAYLFTGSRGTGKTTCAKIFSKAINCQSPVNGSPCGKCEVCKALEDESNMDILEIDAASNNGVDEIREIRDKVKFPPVSAKYKVYIIDEVHMLSINAFNALLKTLEEPPKHAVFILATTEVRKLPATILSRCLRFDFRLVASSLLEKLLKDIFAQVNISCDEDSLKVIANAGEGSVRDTLSIADSVIAYGNNNVTYDIVLNVLGVSDRETIIKLADSIISGDIGGVLDEIHNAFSSGKNLISLSKDLTTHFRDLMVIKNCKDSENILSLPKDLLEKLSNQANTVSAKKLLAFMEKLSGIEADLKYALNPRVLLEITCLECASLDENGSKKN